MVRFAPVQQAEPFLREFYAEVTDDTDPSAADVVSSSSCCLWIECSLDNAPVGGFMLIPDGKDFDVITILRPPARGKRAVALAKEALTLLRDSYPNAKVSGLVFGDNRKAQVFVHAVGLHRTGSGTTLRNSVSVGTTRYSST